MLVVRVSGVQVVGSSPIGRCCKLGLVSFWMKKYHTIHVFKMAWLQTNYVVKGGHTSCTTL